MTSPIAVTRTVSKESGECEVAALAGSPDQILTKKPSLVRSPSSPRRKRTSDDARSPAGSFDDGDARPPKRVNSYSELNFGAICRVDSLASMALPELGATESSGPPPPASSPSKREAWAPRLADITASPVAATRSLGGAAADAAPRVERAALAPPAAGPPPSPVRAAPARAAPAASPVRRSARHAPRRDLRRRENSFSELGLVGEEPPESATPPSPPIEIKPPQLTPSLPVAVARSWDAPPRDSDGYPQSRSRGFTETLDFGGFSPSPTRKNRSASSWL